MGIFHTHCARRLPLAAPPPTRAYFLFGSNQSGQPPVHPAPPPVTLHFATSSIYNLHQDCLCAKLLPLPTVPTTTPRLICSHLSPWHPHPSFLQATPPPPLDFHFLPFRNCKFNLDDISSSAPLLLLQLTKGTKLCQQQKIPPLFLWELSINFSTPTWTLLADKELWTEEDKSERHLPPSSTKALN